LEIGFFMSHSKPISVERLEQLSGEMVRPLRFNKLYQSHLNRPDLANLLKDLSNFLKSKGLKYISCTDLKVAAMNAYSQSKKEKKIGECYQLQTFGGAKYIFGVVAREISISAEEQKKIEDSFVPSKKPYHLGQLDSELVLSGRLSV